MQTDPGTRFGRYELLAQIGVGGMGEVFRARDHDLHRDVAIKFLPERFASDPERLARFAQEARTASSLNHPNIVTIHEIGQREGCPYIVMEYVDGETLRRIVERGRLLAPKQMLDIAAQIADGLAKAHAARIVHRDLKPENVMVTKDGFVKILDFGLAKLRADAEDGFNPPPVASEALTNMTPNTAVGFLLGTAGYMSPEQVRGLPADHRSDQFALGAILYELATGRRAFHRDSVVQTLSAIIDTQPRPIAELNPPFPPPARWAIERCLAKEPAERYASTLDLAHELRGIRERLGEAATSGIERGLTPPGRRFRWLHVTSAVAVILAVWFLTPVVRDAWRRWAQPAPLTGEVRLAILFDDSRVAAADRERLAGLLDYVVIRLADLNRFRSSFSVVPASELRDGMVRGPGEAKRRVGANFAVSLTLQRAERGLVVSGTLEDTERLRVLGGDQKTFPGDEFSAENAVDLIASILRLDLPSEQHAAWMAGASGVAEARSLFAKGLTQKTPYQTGLSVLEKSDLEQNLHTSIDYFNRAIELDPRYADAYAKLGEAYLLLYRLTRRQEHIALAAQNATTARGLDDTRPSTWITLGMIDAQKRAYAEAERDFRNAIDRGPRSSLAYREFARAQLGAGRTGEAEASFRKAIELDPEAWSNHNALGGFLYTSKRFEEAEQAFRVATSKAPDNARVWSNLGGLYYSQSRFGDAEKALEHAMRLYEYGPALSNLATIKFRVRRQYSEAARILERAVKAAPRDSRIWQNLAAAYHWAPGERDRAADAQRKAIAILEEAQRIEPDNPELIADLAEGHAMLRDEQKARLLIARAVKLAPSNRQVALDAAAVYEGLGDRDAALTHVGAALAAGAAPFDFESGPTFAALVKDSRYVKLVKQAGR